jgi:hypothetical protein
MNERDGRDVKENYHGRNVWGKKKDSMERKKETV